jgi:hypothetical protein
MSAYFVTATRSPTRRCDGRVKQLSLVPCFSLAYSSIVSVVLCGYGCSNGKPLMLRRYERRIGSWLALFALALQLTVSFGHIHLEGLVRANRARAALAAAGHASQSLLQPSGAGGDDDDYCPICASVFLSSHSFVPAAPVLSIPSISSAVEHSSRTAPIFILPRRPVFQPRAPPLA